MKNIIRKNNNKKGVTLRVNHDMNLSRVYTF